MGGGGGGYFTGDHDPEALAERARQAEQEVSDAKYSTDVAEYLAKQLATFNDRDVDQTRETLEKVVEAIAEEVADTVQVLFGGSVAKHTYVDGLSDIDALVILGETVASVGTPDLAKAMLARTLADRFGDAVVTVGTLAVTLTQAGQEIQLLPAQRINGVTKISNAAGTGWASVQPEAFAKKLTAVNQHLSGKLVPAIKLAKAIIARFPEQRRLTGYHIESLAIAGLRDYNGLHTPKALLHQFFDRASELIRAPIKDSSGQSVHVDEYLGSSNSLDRRIRADSLDRIARRIRNADGAKSLTQWMQLFGD